MMVLRQTKTYATYPLYGTIKKRPLWVNDNIHLHCIHNMVGPWAPFRIATPPRLETACRTFIKVKVNWSRGWVEVCLYSSMTVALEGGEWSAARPSRTLPPGKTWYPFYRRLEGPQDRSGRAEYLVPTGIRSRTVQPAVSRYTDWAIRPTRNSTKYLQLTCGVMYGIYVHVTTSVMWLLHRNAMPGVIIYIERHNDPAISRELLPRRQRKSKDTQS